MKLVHHTLILKHMRSRTLSFIDKLSMSLLISILIWTLTCFCSITAPIGGFHVISVYAGRASWSNDNDFPLPSFRVRLHDFRVSTTVRILWRRGSLIKVSIPLGFALVPVAFAYAFVASRSRSVCVCTRCGYSLRGLSAGLRCPECGQVCVVSIRGSAGNAQR